MRKIFFVLAVFLSICRAFAQESVLVDTCRANVYFRQGSSVFEPSLSGNEQRMSALVGKLQNLQLDSLCKIKSIRIVAGASPEGNTDYNRQLSKQRAIQISDYFRRKTSFGETLISTEPLGIDWQGLTSIVDTSSMPYKIEALNILRHTPEWIVRDGKIVDGRKHQLQSLHSGQVWHYMYRRYFPQLRMGYITVTYHLSEPVLGIDAESVPEVKGFVTGEVYVKDASTGELLGTGNVDGEVEGKVISIDRNKGFLTVQGTVNGTSTGAVVGPVTGTVHGQGTVYNNQPIQVKGEILITKPVEIVGIDSTRSVTVTGTMDGSVKLDETVSEEIRHAIDGQSVKGDTLSSEPAPVVSEPEKPQSPRPFMSIKTNLLYDAALVPNLGVEFHLGRGWSVGADWMYAWWRNDKRHKYWRIYGGELDIRKYFGRLASERPLSGHHIGIYGQMLTYDIETGGKGYMGGKPGGTLWDRMNWGTGLEYGYSLPIGRRLNLDFGIGFGYLGGEYKTYEPKDGHYVWQETRQRNWIGPTKAEISLVWLIGNKKIRK